MSLENNFESKKPKLGLDKLEEIISYLKSLEMRVAIRDLEDAKSYLNTVGFSLPLVRDGADGIRADYDKKRDQLKIWFTNGFEDPSNEKRVEIQEWIKNNFS